MTNQAAQTMHPDALPDGTLSKSTAKRVEVLAAASVSERARVASVLGPAETLMKMQPHEGERGNSSDLTGTCEDSAKPTKAEQALTQQRGHGEAVDRDAWAEALELPQGYAVEEFLPGGWHYAWTRADGERMVSGTTWNHPALAAIAAWQYAPATTPQPSADAVRELVRKWRELSVSMPLRSYTGATLGKCADELESLLSGGSHA